MAGTSNTNDLFFAAVCVYLYGDSVLLKVENFDRDITFEFAIPEEDMRILWEQFSTDSDELSLKPKSFAKAHGMIKNILRQMQRGGRMVWTTPSWKG